MSSCLKFMTDIRQPTLSHIWTINSLQSVDKLQFSNQRIPEQSTRPLQQMAAKFATGPQYRAKSAAFFVESAAFMGPVRHQLTSFDKICGYCKALHWAEEAVKSKTSASTIDQPISLATATPINPGVATNRTTQIYFSHCCQDGRIVLPQLEPPPSILWDLLVGTTTGTIYFEIFSYALH
jgi:hypothetical protein